jgi:hypothetical protein
MFYPWGGDTTTFAVGRKLRILGCVTKEDLTKPTDFQSKDRSHFIIGKDGNTTGLTIGCYNGLVSFTNNNVGIVSTELGIYNSGPKNSELFATPGDSGSLVWHVEDGKGYIVGQLHSGENKGSDTSRHVTYCTPGWYLLDQIKKHYEHTEFYCTTW